MLELRHIMFERDNKKILNDINLTDRCRQVYCNNRTKWFWKINTCKNNNGNRKARFSGQVIFEGQDITDKTIDERARMGIGFAFQQPVKFKGITVLRFNKTYLPIEKWTEEKLADILSHSWTMCQMNI